MSGDVEQAHAALVSHTQRFGGQLLTSGTFAFDEFDAGDAWVRSIWLVRPETR